MPKVSVGGRIISLNKNNFLAQGGEGAVYAKGKTAFKIYTDKSKMIPAGKIRELATLTDPKIIKPEEVIFSGKINKPIGYTMQYVTQTEPLCRVFTKSFKDRNSITPEMSFDLVKNMHNTIEHIHKKGILIVDLNEMNFLTCKKFKDVYFIDVDSYQTQTHPATALMESVRDRHMNLGTFTTGTDWFSFAVVSFQVFIGIHPYKGKHSSLKGFDARMSANVSVFNKDVNVPKSCLSLKVIPSQWRDWYKAVFEKGLRECPPREGEVVCEVVTIVQAVDGSNNFVIKELFECDADIINYEPNFGNDCVVCKGGIRMNNGAFVDHPHKISIGYYKSTPMAARIEDDHIRIFNIKMRQDATESMSYNIKADELMSTGGRIYAKQNDKILEVEFIGPEHKPIVTAKIIGTVMEKATQLFSGVAIQSVLESYVTSVFPEAGKCLQHTLTELEGYRVINARYDGGVLIIIGVKKGKYDRFVYGSDMSKPRIAKDIQSYDVNFRTLDNGICISIIDTEDVEVFSAKNVHKVKVVQDNVIHGDMKIFNDGNTVMFADGKKMFSMRMK